MPYQHLFFDLDHTLWDFDGNSRETLHILYEEFQLSLRGVSSFDHFFNCYTDHNEKLWIRFRRGYINREELRWKRMWHTLLEFRQPDLSLMQQLSERYLEILPTRSRLVPYAKEILDYCQEQCFHLHIITNGFHATQLQKMRTTGILSYFEAIISSENSKFLKPKKEIFDYALQATGASTATALMIGDALEADILGAQTAGWDQIYFNAGRKPHAERPTYEVACLSRLKEIL